MILQSLLNVQVAEVYKAGVRAATIARQGGGTVFRYDQEYAGEPIATSLPLNVGNVFSPAGAVPPFFANLLPEGRRLSALRRAIKTSADDELSLLLAVGHDTIGDVQVLPQGGHPAPPAQVEPADLSRTTFHGLFQRALGLQSPDRAGLPGVQDKLSGRMIAVPLTWGEQPAILKLEPSEFPHLVANEAFFLDLARDVGLQVPDHQLVHDANGAAGLLIRRFDRVSDGRGGWRSLAQEDACQVLGLYPADKYRPSSEDALRALASVCGAPLVSARDHFRQVAFAYLTCNGDQHAKNLSILKRENGEWAASPAYDLPSTHPYGDVTTALDIDGRQREDIGRRNLLALASTLGLAQRAATRVLDELVDRLAGKLDNLDELPFDQRKIHKLRRAIRWRLDRVSE